MKKLNLFSILVLAAILTLGYTSCTEDLFPPSITLESGDNYISSNAQVDPDANITVKVKATKGTDALNLFTIYENGTKLPLERITSGINANPALLSGAETDLFEKEITFKSQSSGESDYLFVIEDSGALKDSIGFTLTLNPKTELNLFVDSLKVGNFKGPDYGSIDLQTGTTVASSNASGDVQDIGWVEGTTQWAKRIKVKNGTEMAIPASAINYDDITILEDLIDAYNAGSKAEVSGDISVGDIFLFKSPTGNAGIYDYFIMKTVEVHESPADNLDYYIFALKGYTN